MLKFEFIWIDYVGNLKLNKNQNTTKNTSTSNEVTMVRFSSKLVISCAQGS